MWNARHALIASRCAWCSQVWTGEDWILERRTSDRETYSNGICPSCAALHFSASQDLIHLNVERFKMTSHHPMGVVSALAKGKPRLAKALYGGSDE